MLPQHHYSTKVSEKCGYCGFIATNLMNLIEQSESIAILGKQICQNIYRIVQKYTMIMYLIPSIVGEQF